MSSTGHGSLSPTARSTVRRYHERAATDRQALYDVLDAGLVCHLGFVADGGPVVLPSVYGREGDTLYLHASAGARSARVLGAGAPICVTVTHLDAIVYARSVYHNSVNYRSAVVHGTGRLLREEEEKRHGMRVVAEHLAPGAWDYGHGPDRKVLARVAVMTLDLAEASVKIRDAPPNDHGDQVDPDRWAGLLPVRTSFGIPQPEARVPDGLPVPEHIRSRRM
ncbi:pyridoxamine 5'-phosphate oxidase family protein [Streptosporangium roseum]|uniref:pyridoxamine 5'-phosphate oxidase family protein n=1 Tax=Streptosporangium roseum TaxID=2001 RepID=UPI0004CD433A|nr:pyridoxamine 5'-phosphate oxidase family protein [Streptosporangium roseum]